MEEVRLTIDGRVVSAPAGARVLEAALVAGIYIPNLCFMPEADEPLAGCRLCLVEVEGRTSPLTACTEPVLEGMVVHTATPRVRRLQRTAAGLIIAAHQVECGVCGKNRHCDLQRIAAFLRVKMNSRRFRKMPRSLAVDDSNPFFTRNMNKCVLCGKCVTACRKSGGGVIDFAFRGPGTIIAPFANKPMAQSRCNSCGECVVVCPVGALLPKEAGWPERHSQGRPAVVE